MKTLSICYLLICCCSLSTLVAQNAFTENHFIACGTVFVSDTLGYPTWNPPSITQSPVHGTAQFLGDINMFPTLQYTPNNDFEGIDTVVVACAQATQISCSTGIYVFYVDCDTNNPPVAQNDTICSVGGLQNQVFPASDPDEDPLNYIITAPPTFGTLTVNPDGTFNYEQQAVGFYDSFSFKACEPTGACSNATVYIMLAEIDTVPLPQPTQYYHTTTDTIKLCGGLGYAFLHNGEPNLYTVFLNNNPTKGSMTYLDDDCILYTPMVSNATDTITLTACGDAPPPTFFTCQGSVQLSNCTITQYIIGISDVDAITNLPLANLQIIPNPSQTHCRILGLEQLLRPTIQVFDSTGKALFSDHLINNTPNYSINLQNYPNGMYWVQITDQNHSAKLKLVKQ